MSRAPLVMPKAENAWSRKAEIFDTTLGWRFLNPKLAAMYHPYSMGETAENVASQWQVTREEQDAFAFQSQQKYFEALRADRWKDEIVGIEIETVNGRKRVEVDEHPRETSLEKLAQLKPAFLKEGTVTAGNASGINDGAAALLLATESAINKYGLKPLARIVSMGVAGVDPSVMGIGPVPASKKALSRARINEDQLDLIELNEAFASQSIACIRELHIDPANVNVNGGAIALGHPLGASGARITTTLVHEMKRRKSKYGLATMCVGVGQGAALVVEGF
jgi:acetyl-CoA acetyltransferase family protein